MIHDGLVRVRDTQTTTVWTGVPVCATFVNEYWLTIDYLDQTVGVIWTEVGRAVDGLRSAAADWGIVDGDVADALNALVGRVENHALTPAPEPVGGSGAVGETGGIVDVDQKVV